MKTLKAAGFWEAAFFSSNGQDNLVNVTMDLGKVIQIWEGKNGTLNNNYISNWTGRYYRESIFDVKEDGEN
ncbi:hypothetical protein [Paenibacillus cineris]|uniref:hypothetical protein n=1 Tax=Paenibacillus cineris TaxID=237530 RepID=UPI001B041E48|nr:hypothetical protein [Paenibacillus cineris]GIO63992.1 hypothetical protein J43TS9_55660 [Paenibacillus cineris]